MRSLPQQFFLVIKHSLKSKTQLCICKKFTPKTYTQAKFSLCYQRNCLLVQFIIHCYDGPLFLFPLFNPHWLHVTWPRTCRI